MGCNISIYALYSPLKSAAKVTPVPEKRESLTNSLSTKNSADKTINQLFLEKQSNELSPDRRAYLSKASEEISQFPTRPVTRASSIVSLMQNRPPSGISNSSFTRVYKARNFVRNFTIDTSHAKSNQPVVSLCSKKIGIEEYPEGREDNRPCDVFWHNVVYSDMKNLVRSANSKVNKFPGMTELAKKISLTHAISSMQHLFPTEYSFYPKSWFLPAHFSDFQKFCKDKVEQQQKQGVKVDMWFIVKPDEGAQGNGIYLISNPDQIQNPHQKQLVQEYIADPFLMSDHLKFDFRVYGLIKSINPLSIYVAREGMARFCTEKYSKPDASNFENLYAHLTNYSLNKGNESYVHSYSLEDQSKGSKRLLSTVFHQLESRGLKTKKLWHEIKMILIKTVLAMLPEIMLHYEHHFYDLNGPQCFQIMGFDIMISSDGTPILLEVNAAPSMTIDHVISLPGKPQDEAGQKIRSIVDEVIKIPLVKDTLLLVLGLFDEEYSMSSRKVSSSSRSVDDMGTLRTKRKPHLSEIFPTRYGAHSGHLLFLDKAMYIYMQFLQLRNTTNISAGGLKQFIRKCNLSNIIQPQEVDGKMAEINYFFTGDMTTVVTGLPFHAFLKLLFYIAEKKFKTEDNLLSKMQRLLAFCDMSLRYYGVRSARLRRTEVDTNQEENPVEIYMLPNRMRGKRRSRSTEPAKVAIRRSKADRNNNTDTLSLPKIV